MTYTYEPHAFNWKLKSYGREICGKCGLIPLNNKFTQWAIRMGCNNSDHKDYEKYRKGSS